MRKAFLAFSLVFLLPALLFAQEGKLRGVVADKETGEPLPGANVTIVGTTLGASSDLNGAYVILGVSPGVYTIKASYIGYQAVAISNIRVSANLTTTQDFKLAPSALEVGALEVMAERPLVQRNTTNTVRMTTQEDIQNLPIRGLQNIISFSAGTVQQDGVLHVRGGRAGEIAYFIDGANVTNPFFNSENITVIQEAIEEIQLQSGGYTAEFGGANSAVVRTNLRSGGEKFKATIDYRTDDFAKPGEKFLGTSSFGYRNGVVTLNGPVPFVSKMRFFIAGQHNYIRNRQVMFIEPFRFDSLTTDGTGGLPAGVLLPGAIEFEQNYLPRNWWQDNSVQGTVTYDLNPLKFRFTGSHQDIRNPVGHSWPGAVANFFNFRDQKQERKYTLVNLKATHLLGPSTFYEAAISYTNRSFRQFDPDFGDNWPLYADSVESAKLGYTGFVNRYVLPLDYRTISGFTIFHPSSPNLFYGRNNQSNIGASLDFTTQITKRWELKAGGRYDRWTMRLYSVGNTAAAMAYLFGQDGKTPRQFESENQRRIELSKRGAISYYGYDVDGNKLNSGVDGPRHPSFGALYLQNKLEFRDLVLNFGLRYERIDINEYQPDNFETPSYDPKLDYIDESTLQRSPVYDYLLPRVNFAFPVTEKTVFYAQYGKYVQMPALNEVILSVRDISRIVLPTTRSPYGFFGNLAGFTAKPERTTQYEVGIRQLLSDNFAFTITTFYKDLRDQLRRDRFVSTGEGDIAEGNVVFSGLFNNDFGTVKGMELTLELRRTKRLAASVNYTLSSSRGTGSDSRSSRVVVSDETTGRYPTLIYNLDYNQPHRGSILVDYRFPKGDGGPILQGTGLNLVMTFNSGHSYTQIEEPSNLGQATPFNVGVRATIDPRNRHPVESLNTSFTPWNFNVDMNLSKKVSLAGFNTEFYVHVLNLLNTKNVINVYPTTGTAEDDGWLRSPLAAPFAAIPNYLAFYNAINVQNRWGYFTATGNDIYDAPRQMRFGVLLEF